MRNVTGILAVLLVSTAGVAHAGLPVVVDREGTMQQVAQLQAQLGALDQQIYALRPQNPQAIDQLRVALQQALQQAQQLDRQLRRAPAAQVQGGVVVNVPPPSHWGDPQQPPPGYPPPGYPPPGGPPPGGGRHHGGGVPQGPMVIDEGQLGEITSAIEGEAFSDGKINVLREAAGSWMFTVDQVKRVIGLYAFSKDKLNALRVLAPRIADRQNNFKIYDAFTFSGDKEQARRILSGG